VRVGSVAASFLLTDTGDGDRETVGLGIAETRQGNADHTKGVIITMAAPLTAWLGETVALRAKFILPLLQIQAQDDRLQVDGLPAVAKRVAPVQVHVPPRHRRRRRDNRQRLLVPPGLVLL
jgi:hypothetical protein